MDTHTGKLNRNLVIGWMIIVIVLFITYCGEVIKGERTVGYVIIFIIVTVMPALLALFKFIKKPDLYALRYYIVVGYFFMYIYVMLTGSTVMVFSYILPMLSYLVLYHQPKLILGTGIAALTINVISIINRARAGLINLSDSKDVEIQIALLVLCFTGSYFACRIYDEITKENESYVGMLEEKNTQIKKMTLQTITTIANTIDAKDDYTKGHSKRVAEYTVAIARELGVTKEQEADIRSIALLHDIGKIGVPDSVLNKPGKLSNQEYELMKKHTVVGGDILKDINMLKGLDVGAKYHHERMDGKGYPEGKHGDEIPKIARIIAVADAFDAMTSNRVYRKALDIENVLLELERGRGTQFDAVADDALIRLIKENRITIIAQEADDSENEKTAGTILSRVIEQNEQKTRDELSIDKLTGAYNRIYGVKLIEEKLCNEIGCVGLFDVDNFRRINNTVGFAAGDRYLETLVEAIKKTCPDCVVVRIGSDEFMAYSNKTDTFDKVDKLAKHFYAQLEESKKEKTGVDDLSVSVGFALCERFHEELNDLMLRADKALYMVKHQGGGRYFIDHRDDKKWKKETSTETDLEKLVDYVKKNNVDVDETAILFTVLCNVGIKVNVEEKNHAIEFLEKSICRSIRDDDKVLDYSGSQKLLLLKLADKQQAEIVADRILREFYRMYDEKKLYVKYDITEASSH